MRIRAVAVAVLTLATVHTLPAQGSCATAPIQTQDACITTTDIFQYVTPQLGVVLTGGNAVLGQGGVIGGLPGLPRFSIGVRGTVLNGNLPTIQTPSITGPAPHTASNPYPTTDQYMALPSADASLSLFRGFTIGPTRVGGIGVFANASFVPTVTVTTSGATFSIDPDTPLGIGYGARIGIIGERLLLPGVEFSYALRTLPKTGVVAATGGDSLTMTDYKLDATSWRVTAAKSFVAFTIAAGVGQDTYDTESTLEAIVNRPVPVGRVTTGPVAVSQTMTRMNVFGNFALNLVIAKLVVEGGLVSGGDITTANVFDVAPGADRVYGSVGLRLGF
ncbi:MAG TPA: hypothetical protein VKH19_01090 [Gemmatimonadaceae bacterium]|nr:hypothetical protein [Gemmatimonadaceae bacterium]